MKIARLVACMLMALCQLCVEAGVWAQMNLGEFSTSESHSGGVGSPTTVGVTWTSLSRQPSGLVWDASTELSLTNLAAPFPRQAGVANPERDEPFSLSQQAKSGILVGGVVAAASPHVPVASVAEIVGGNQQLLDLGGVSESLRPLSLPLSTADALLGDDRGAVWLPTAEVR